LILSINYVKFEINLLIANERNLNLFLNQALNGKINQVLDSTIWLVIWQIWKQNYCNIKWWELKILSLHHFRWIIFQWNGFNNLHFFIKMMDRLFLVNDSLMSCIDIRAEKVIKCIRSHLRKYKSHEFCSMSYCGIIYYISDIN
jgi:hypothetical protein